MIEEKLETLTEENAKPGLIIRDKFNAEWPDFKLGFRGGHWRGLCPNGRGFIIYPDEFNSWWIVGGGDK